MAPGWPLGKPVGQVLDWWLSLRAPSPPWAVLPLGLGPEGYKLAEQVFLILHGFCLIFWAQGPNWVPASTSISDRVWAESCEMK